ncbi:hypothetical protein DL96DRAFT_1709197 [Flagelloscypha sp. PMI_526]|nr:hypothetical protein DL96DRAFT_1709197 [Flagelloscypha sp. PMI_526]
MHRIFCWLGQVVLGWREPGKEIGTTDDHRLEQGSTRPPSSSFQQWFLPLSLLNAAQNKPMLVELKNGETFNGHLVNCDNFMNITLREVYQTNPEGDRFWKLKECYVRGSTIKYLRIPDQLLDQVKDEQNRARDANRGGRGGHVGGSRGRGAPPRGGRGGRGMRARGRGRGM